MAHEMYAMLTKRLFTDGCVQEEAGHYLDDTDPDDVAEYLRGLLATRVEGLIEAYGTWHDTFPTHDELIGVIGTVIPKQNPTVGDCTWTLRWVMDRAGSPIRVIQVQGEDEYRYALVYGEDAR